MVPDRQDCGGWEGRGLTMIKGYWYWNMIMFIIIQACQRDTSLSCLAMVVNIYIHLYLPSFVWVLKIGLYVFESCELHTCIAKLVNKCITGTIILVVHVYILSMGWLGTFNILII